MAYRDSTFTAGLGGGGGNVTLPTLVAGDYCAILLVSDASGDLDDATIVGFTRESVQNIGTPDTASFAYFERINCTGSEGATATAANVTPSNAAAVAVSLSGRATAAPRSFLTPTTDTNTNASPVSISGTGGSAVAGDDLIFFVGLDPTSANLGWVFSQPTSFTEREDPGGASEAWCPVYCATLDNHAGGATGAVATTATLASQSAGWCTFVAAIKSSTAPPYTPPVTPITAASMSR